jgi:hypothetical protein
MAEPEVEAAWQNEFKRIHATKALDRASLSPDDPKTTFRWSGDEAETHRLQEEHTHHYIRWVLFGAIAVMIVGLIGVVLSFVN